MTRKTSKTPAHARRNALVEKIRARGDSPYNIWMVRPPFEDDDLLLTSDPAMELFYWVEGEPSFVDISYAPLRSAMDAGTQLDGREFAQCVMGDETTLTVVWCGAATPDTAPGSETQFLRVTLTDLNANAQRVENWRRIVPCIRRVRLHPTAMLERQVLLALRGVKHRSVRYLVNARPEGPAALTVGAIAILLRKRLIIADVDTRPWSSNTLVWSVQP